MTTKILITLMLTVFPLLRGFSFEINKNNLIRYQYVHFSIKNKMNYPVTLTFVGSDGKWKKPILPNLPIILNSNEQYQNTLVSIKSGNDFKSFASMDVAQIGNSRDNYVIFAESGDSQKKRLSQDIFDGMGKIFVGSITNHCLSDTPAGYADCKLTIEENSAIAH